MLIMLNCRNLHHAERYGRFDAFFDLDREKHDHERLMLYSNATCCVVSYADIKNRSGNVKLAYWHYREMFENDDFHTWFLVGMKIGECTMPKADLAAFQEFDGVIARDGDFNQFSIKLSAK